MEFGTGMMTTDSCDFLLVAALPKEFHRGVRSVLKASRLPKAEGDTCIYYAAEYNAGGERNYQIRLCCVGRKGATATAVRVVDAISRWHPKHVVMFGIAAVVPGGGSGAKRRKMGDVLVAERIIDIPETKKALKDEPRPESLPCERELLDFIRLEMTQRFDGRAVHLGDIVSQPNLSKNAKYRDSLVSRIERFTSRKGSVVGLEMEGGGLSEAVGTRSAVRRPGLLLVKGAVDWANYHKADAHQTSTATRVARFVRTLIEKNPLGGSVETERGSSVLAGKPSATDGTGALASSARSLSPSRLTCCSWASSDQLYAAGFDGRVYRVGPGSEIKSIAIGGSIVRACMVDPRSGEIVTGDDDGRISVVSAGGHSVHTLATTGDPIYSIAASATPDRILIAQRSGAVSEWKWHKLKASRLREVHRHQGAAFTVRYDAAGDRCLSVGGDGQLWRSSFRTGKTTAKRITHSSLFGLSVSRGGSIAIGDSAGCIWLTQGSAKARKLSGHTDTVRSVQFSPSGTWLLTGSKDRSVRLWHVETGMVRELLTVEDYVYDVAFNEDATKVAVVDGKGCLVLVSLPASVDSLAPQGRWMSERV